HDSVAAIVVEAFPVTVGQNVRVAEFWIARLRGGSVATGPFPNVATHVENLVRAHAFTVRTNGLDAALLVGQVVRFTWIRVVAPRIDSAVAAARSFFPFCFAWHRHVAVG